MLFDCHFTLVLKTGNRQIQLLTVFNNARKLRKYTVHAWCICKMYMLSVYAFKFIFLQNFRISQRIAANRTKLIYTASVMRV
jgi:hypothetical protein